MPASFASYSCNGCVFVNPFEVAALVILHSEDSSTPKKIFKIGKRLVQLHTHQYSSQSLMYMLESIN
ncbi:hypothetical protein Plhal304r1_c027g0089511 [Plasmopara halstedii]